MPAVLLSVIPKTPGYAKSGLRGAYPVIVVLFQVLRCQPEPDPPCSESATDATKSEDGGEK
jgi:hypothetical protein